MISAIEHFDPARGEHANATVQRAEQRPDTGAGVTE
jgi:hypothetical protein